MRALEALRAVLGGELPEFGSPPSAARAATAREAAALEAAARERHST